MNITITVPPGTVNHGDPRLICTPPIWTDFVIFYATNYFVHALTLPSRPGESILETCFTVLTALFLPSTGSLRAARWLLSHAGTVRRDELSRAIRAGALCMVVDETERSKVSWIETSLRRMNFERARSWYDIPTPQWYRSRFRGAGRWVHSSRTIHGTCVLPKGFILVEVPVGTPLMPPPGSGAAHLDRSNIQLGSTYNIPKALFALGQAAWGVTTVYRTQGDQLQRYGYAAFGVTVAPYAFMSLVNLIALLVTPEYNCIYLVHTPDLDKAKRLGGRFSGMVASVDLDSIKEPLRTFWPSQAAHASYFAVTTVLLLMPAILVAGVTGFSPGHSTIYQQVWILSWLIFGIVMGPVIRMLTVFPSEIHGVYKIRANDAIAYALDRATFMQRAIDWLVAKYFRIIETSFYLYVIIGAAICFTPAIGGMVVVGQMLQEFGVCRRLDTTGQGGF
ncbi:hypothetical protein CABS01_09867 [Colletotrichum abscissum]|uniref:Uncharacterized protein n=2 Tax=Colletotrichum acutatum species complex TaxID=2707335 RepID=A0A9P9XNY5_9PEZI|nr:uncharacterized protein CTAM01_11208 [Colletotrichum tamarilloi]XP_060399921.1 uncharacterized protein CABS01_09867 [Colletotrichum abscissum]KAI3556926.1 hypothetical protein CABS02_02933 [Colletotrichum abscissum]KAK1489059.1 hypothetical protein CTAM01_11208 [Colletotrichum tamarilloi]KAK1501132.1 hypothetical protein CABS01_09867 [Colletotrichum abscissum]